jgi:hypothetical protein
MVGRAPTAAGRRIEGLGQARAGPANKQKDRLAAALRIRRLVERLGDYTVSDTLSFLRRAKKPIIPRPPANRGSAAGKGVAARSIATPLT